MLYTEVRGLSPFNGNEELINWAKKLRLQFGVTRQYSDAEVVARVQLKQASTIGALAAKGIGLKILNYALWGESYGTELGEVDLGVTLTSRYVVDVLIEHNPSVPEINWYVDTGSGMVLRGTQATSAKIPQTVSTDVGLFVHSIADGATGGVAVYGGMNTPVLWQER